MLWSMDQHIVQFGAPSGPLYTAIRRLWGLNEEIWEDLWALANKSYVRRSPRQWPTDNQRQGFRNFPCQRYLLSCWPCFSEWPLNFATMEGADKREILCWPAFPNVSIRLLHFAYCTLNRGTGGLAILVQLHSTALCVDLHNTCTQTGTIQLHIEHS